MTKLSLTCPHCGSNQFIYPDNPNLQSNVICSGCSQGFLVSELAELGAKKEAIRLAGEATRSAFGKLLK